jgi:hypothetical protein
MAYTNFNIIQGDTWTLTITYTDSENTPIDISNYQITAEVRDKPGGKIVCGTITTEAGQIVSDLNDSTGATIIATFPGSMTEKFVLPKSYYQIKIIDTADTLLNGWVELEATNI